MRHFAVFVVTVVVGASFSGCDNARPPSKPTTSAKSSVMPKPTVGPPDLAMLYAKASEPMLLTEEQKAEEAAYDRHQVEIYGQQLVTGSSSQRIAAVEQLGAYFTPVAEQHLARALISDVDAEVRLTVAHVLENQNKLSHIVLEALLTAVLDRRPEVQSAAILALAATLNKEEQTAQREWILARLRRLSTAKQLSKQGAGHLRELLEQWPDNKSKVVVRQHR